MQVYEVVSTLYIEKSLTSIQEQLYEESAEITSKRALSKELSDSEVYADENSLPNNIDLAMKPTILDQKILRNKMGYRKD